MVFLSFSGADRLQGKSAQKCGPRPSVPRNRRNSSRVRSECAGAGPLGPRGRGTAAAGRVDGARRARAQIPGVGKGLSTRPAAAVPPPRGPRGRAPARSDRTRELLRRNLGTDGRGPHFWAPLPCNLSVHLETKIESSIFDFALSLLTCGSSSSEEDI